MRVLADAEVTSAGIASALSKLTAEVKQRDIVVIHFSSHGEQVEDDNGDELDGKDECVVPFDAVAPSLSKNFKQDKDKYFRDDEFGRHLANIRNKLGNGGDLIVFMDFCTSGSGSRGLAVSRGGEPPLLSTTFDASKFTTRDTAGLQGEFLPVVSNKHPSNFIIYSAAMDGEDGYEIRDDMDIEMGSLTYAICKAFEKLEPTSSYRSFFSDIKTIIHSKSRNQHPVMEGNEMDRQIFAGSFVSQKPYAEMIGLDKNLVTLNAGKFSGLSIGAKVGMYHSGTAEPAAAKPVATGVVVDAANYSSTVILNTIPVDIQSKAYWFFTTQPLYRMPPVNIHIISLNEDPITGFSNEEIEKIKKGLSKLSGLSFNGVPQLTIKKGLTFDSLINSSNDYPYRVLKISADQPANLQEAIADYIRYQFLQNVEIRNPAINAEVRLFRWSDAKVDSTSSAIKRENFRVGDEVVVWARNNGKAPVYLNILDLQPDGQINPVFPNRLFAIYPHDLKLGPGESKLFTDFRMTILPPYGTEIYKIFVSNRQIDLESIATNRENDRGQFSILEELVKKSYRAGERGSETQNISNADGSTYNILFTIKAR